MHKRCQRFGWLHVRQDANQAAVRHAPRGCNLVGVFQLDSLGSREVGQLVQFVANFTRKGAGEFWQFRAFGLDNILSRDLRPSPCAPDRSLL
jgi:hypothetical protein